MNRADFVDTSGDDLHLYQDCASQPTGGQHVESRRFYEFLTKDPTSMIHLPAIAFVELRLGNLVADPEFGAVGDLPYPYIHHLRESLIDVRHRNRHIPRW